MTISTVHIFYVVLFIGTLLLVEGLYYLVKDRRNGSEGAINRRLKMIAQGGDRSAVLGTLRRSRTDRWSGFIARIFPAIEKMARQAGVLIPLRRIALMAAGVGVLIHVAIGYFTPLPIAAAGLIAVVVAFGGPVVLLARKRKNRLNRIGEQLPEAIDMLVRSLKAGHTTASAVGMVASEMKDPIGSEFGIVLDEMTYGYGLAEALGNLQERVPHPDLQFLVVAVQIQHGTGGSLAEVLNNLATVIRNRQALTRKVRAITSEARMSGYVMALLPVAFAGLVQVSNPTYFGDVRSEPLFLMLMSLAAALTFIGHIVVQRMANFQA